jgi:hypothetical protein
MALVISLHDQEVNEEEIAALEDNYLDEIFRVVLPGYFMTV